MPLLGTTVVDSFGTHVEYLPREPEIYPSVAQINVTLPTVWRLKDMVGWELEYSRTTDNSGLGDWYQLVQLPPEQITYPHTNVDPNYYYVYRYRVRTQIAESEWSEVGYAGQPRVNIAGAIDPGTITQEQLQTASVGTAELIDHNVTPTKISNTGTDIFVFPNKIIATGALQSTATGVIFPDGSTQATALVGSGLSKSAQTLGAITSGVAVGVTHNLGTNDLIAVVAYDTTTGSNVTPTAITRTSVNAVNITFGASYSASVIRVVISA